MIASQTPGFRVVSGVPFSIANYVYEGEEFFISYNDIDSGYYGCDTTALVVGQMRHFYILNGDHRMSYCSLIPLGFAACFEYFNKNRELMNKYSDK
jgi:hypothetical protein